MRRQVNSITESTAKINMDGKPKKLPANIRKFVTSRLQKEYGSGYFPKIPLKEIFNILKESYILPVDESGEEWSGMLLGDRSHTSFDLVIYDNDTQEFVPISDSMLVLSWYKMEQTGRYEINAYLS